MAADSRQRLIHALAGERSTPLPMIDLVYWPETLARWRREGLPAAAEQDPAAYFGLDSLACVNDLFNPSPRLPEEIITEDEEHRTLRDRYGKVVRLRVDGGGTPQILEPSVRAPAQWERLRTRLTPGDERFDNPAADAAYRAAVKQELFIAVTPAEPLWFVLEHVMGFEDAMKAVRRHPDLVADMLACYTDYVLAMLAQCHARGYRFDALWFWSDLCYRNGLLLNPREVRRLALPHWQRFGAFARRHDMQFIWHCDGNVTDLIPLLLEAGVHAVHPLEARAGNDVRTLKARYGARLCLIGNINADVIASNDPAAIEAEVAAKIPPLAAAGGYIYHIDHSVPPTVSLAAYHHLLDCVRRYAPSDAA